ncbi:uncharacterized protein LOC122624730 isoform X1 [Drosophila teissieri]|uniref:uncharacterized protein LOC122624730 isoform X1 n=1 Tax=Drosophila teissieri TaxID=7243 RepID=UPI001CBA4FDB|nr:uncharacterized protein LOC122624730 isoform X1 [Drosophila teissieri]
MTVKLHLFVAFLMFSTYYLTEVYSLVEFTNVQCENMDKDFALVEYCYLKSVNRSYKYVSIKVNLLKPPITKVKVRLALYKRLNGYKPFLYDLTVDACRFLKYPKSNPVALFFYNCFKEYSNMNHTCPFDHDIVLDKMSYHSINNKFTKVLAFPEGNYMFEMDWIAYDINRVITKLYFSLS